MTNEKLKQICTINNWFTHSDARSWEMLFSDNGRNISDNDLATIIFGATDGWYLLDIEFIISLVNAIESEED